MTFLKSFFLIIIAILFSVNCTSNLKRFPQHVYRKALYPYRYCRTAEKYSYVEGYKGSYKDFTTTVHSQVKLNEHIHLRASEVSKIIYLVYKSAQIRFPDVDKDKFKRLHDILKSTRVIVNINNKYLQDIWVSKDKTKKKLLGRMIEPNMNCFNMGNNNWFFTIVEKAFRKNNIETVTHESMHLVSWALFNDTDPGHKNPKLWNKYDHKDFPTSLQHLVISQWTKQGQKKAGQIAQLSKEKRRS